MRRSSTADPGARPSVDTLLREDSPPSWVGPDAATASTDHVNTRPPPGIRPSGSDSGGWVRRMWPVWWSHRRVIAVAFSAAVVGMAAQQTAPLLQRYAI